MTTRRTVLKMGVALAAVPLVGGMDAGPSGPKLFSTGQADLDGALGGGIKPGSFVALIGPPGSGKTAFMLRLAKANGIADSHAMNTGGSDMLSIVERADGKHIGSVMLNAPEPSTPKEIADMQRDPAARDAFLTRWFRRSREIVQESGGLFMVSAWGTQEGGGHSNWMSIPDYIIRADQSACSLIKAEGVPIFLPASLEHHRQAGIA
jgi:hypothetical protein